MKKIMYVEKIWEEIGDLIRAKYSIGFKKLSAHEIARTEEFKHFRVKYPELANYLEQTLLTGDSNVRNK